MMNQIEKLRQTHAKEKKEALAEFRSFKRSAKAREESIQAIPAQILFAAECVVSFHCILGNLRQKFFGSTTPGCRQADRSMDHLRPQGNVE